MKSLKRDMVSMFKIKSPKWPLFVLIVILLVGFVLRLYRFDNPIADWHSWRQADTSAVSRNFVKYGFDLLHPRIDNISNVQSGLDNPQGYFFAEFPLYNAAQAGLFLVFKTFTLEQWGRLVTIVASLAGAVFLFLIVKRRGNPLAAWMTLIFSVFLPYNIYYGRTILPDTSMVAAILGGVYFFDRYLSVIARIRHLAETKQSRSSMGLPRSFFARNDGLCFFFLALVFTTSAFLLKPYALFYTLPMVVLASKRWGWKVLLQWQLWVLAIVALVPLVWWRTWMTQFPEGIPANAWLFNGDGIRFRPAFFRWIGYERVIKLIGGYVGGIFLLLGFIKIIKLPKDSLFFLSFLVSALLYVIIIATGNVKHDYYQIVIMPAVTIVMGFGAAWFVTLLQKYVPLRVAYGIVGVCMAVGFWLSWQQVKDYFNINNPNMVLAGKAVASLTPRDAKVLAPLDGDSSFLYQTNRQGWASFQNPLPELIQKGATHLVLVNPTKADLELGKMYKIVSKTPQYVIFDLRKSAELR